MLSASYTKNTELMNKIDESTILNMLRTPLSFSKVKHEIISSIGNLQSEERIAIIPCAGKGKRMGDLDIPKPLYPVAGLPAVVRLMSELRLYFSRFFVPISNKETDLQSFTNGIGDELMKLTTFVPTIPGFGDGDAVFHAINALPEDFTGQLLVIWGDTVILDKNIVPICLRILSTLRDVCKLVVPTTFEREPYVAIIRDKEGRVCDVKYRRRGQFEHNKEHDLSMFFGYCEDISHFLRILVKKLRREKEGYHSFNSELSFLDIIPEIYREGHEVVSPCIGYEGAVMAFNTLEDVYAIEKHIQTRAMFP